MEVRLQLSRPVGGILLSLIKTLNPLFCPRLLSHYPLLVFFPLSWLILPNLLCRVFPPLYLAVKGQSGPRTLFFLWTLAWFQFPCVLPGPLFGTPDCKYNRLLGLFAG